jgi:dienelactone hydrolase
MADYAHLGIYSDLVAAAGGTGALFPSAPPGPQTVQAVRESLNFSGLPEQPRDVQIEQCWERDGIAGEVISWSVGYGPRTAAWLLRPAGVSQPLPGVVALHDHGGFKFYGKEKIAEGPQPANDVQLAWYKTSYGGRAWVDALARRGFAVLVHDTFLWGSRKFPLETMELVLKPSLPFNADYYATRGGLDPVAWYNLLAGFHEHIVNKYCTILGTGLSGVVSYEDRVALNYLSSRPDVLPDRLACAGLSGGGNRSAMLTATADNLSAALVVGLMSTYPALLDQHVATHTWMLFPSGWSRHGDWPDLAACRAPRPLLVQYDTEDDLFTLEGMRQAHERLTGHYLSASAPDRYTGQFYPGPHKFDQEMQEAAYAWLEQILRPGAG